MATIKIDNVVIGDNNPAFVIAEAGINHQGDIEIAKKLIDVAAFSGANAVKFQKRKVKKLLIKEALDKPYLTPNSFGKTYGEHREHLELSEKDFVELKKYAEEKGLIFLASGWDEDSIDFLDSIDTKAFKMASADLTNIPLLEYTAKKGKPIILSTGMAEMKDVRRAYDAVKKYNNQIAILQCTSTYPCTFDNINLRVIHTFIKEFPDCVIGYSGHELGIAVSSAAVAIGAKIVERHFTLDRTMKGSDHAASLEPDGLRKMIRDIRAIEKAMGSPIKTVIEEEIPIRNKLAKSIVAAVSIPKETRISRDMLTFKSPGTGIPPYKWEEIIGKTTKVDIEEDTIIQWEQLI